MCVWQSELQIDFPSEKLWLSLCPPQFKSLPPLFSSAVHWASLPPFLEYSMSDDREEVKDGAPFTPVKVVQEEGVEVVEILDSPQPPAGGAVPSTPKTPTGRRRRAAGTTVRSSSSSSSNHHNHRRHHSAASVAGVYAPLLRLKRKRQADALPVVRLPPKVIGGLRDQVTKSKQCNCKRSNCLKLYCDCFQSGIHCTSLCNCLSCKNLPGTEHAARRTKAILVTLERNPHAFRPRLLSLGIADNNPNSNNSDGEQAAQRSGLTGCNCKKSFCLKKYCECFHAAVYCSSKHCRCTDCQNVEGNEKREMLMAKRRHQEESARAAVAAAQQHSRLSNEGDETVTALGVDAFLPPSTYTIPLRFPNGTPFNALSFGAIDSKKQATTPISTSIPPPPAKQPRPARGRTELERGFDEDAKIRMRQYFGAIHKEISRRQGRPVVESKDSLACPPPPLQQSAVALLDSVQQDMQRIHQASAKAEEETIKLLDEPTNNGQAKAKPAAKPKPRHEKPAAAASTTPDEQDDPSGLTENDLICAESLEKESVPSIPATTQRQLTIYVAQEAAMLREFAAIIRQKTLQMTKQRLLMTKQQTHQ